MNKHVFAHNIDLSVAAHQFTFDFGEIMQRIATLDRFEAADDVVQVDWKIF